MLKRNSLEGLSFFQLKENYPIKPFDCEDDDLNDFLFNKALLYQKELLATTFVVESEERTLGYYSVLNDSLQLKEEDFPSKSKYKKFLSHLIPHPKRHLKSVPAVKIGRLAIDKTRYLVPCGELFFEVDEFYGDNEGLVIAEIELPSENTPFERPEWLGEEVTNEARYYNAMLSKNPYRNWQTEIIDN